jgi:hypothetical protein
MVKRAWLGPLLAALFLAPVAHAKLVPTFSVRSVKPGDVARLDLGEGAEQFLAPLKVYLVPLEVADEAKAQSDPRLTKIGELGSPGQFDVPRTLHFVVPELEAGQYTAAIWFKGTETRSWANALVGMHPRLTIRQAADIGQVERTGAGDSARSDDEGTLFWSALALGATALVAGLVLRRWRPKGQAERVR